MHSPDSRDLGGFSEFPVGGPQFAFWRDAKRFRNAEQKLVPFEGLRDESRGARAERLFDILLVCGRCERDDGGGGCVRQLADFPDGRIAVHDWHLYVHEYQVEVLLPA